MKQVKSYLWLLVILFGCGSDDEPTKSPDNEIIEEYLDMNTITYSVTAEGVYQYLIIENALGNEVGDVYGIYYTLSNLETGDVIDSHLLADGDPIKLKRNANAIFPLGLDYGLAGIKEGETYGIILPSNIGYSNYTTSAFELGTILHFEVEVVSRESESDIEASEDLAINNYITSNDLNNTMTNPIDAVVALSNGIYYKRVAAGNGSVPITGDSITIDYTGTLLDDSSFDALGGFKYKFNSGDVIDGLDLGVSEMEIGERATIFIPSAQAYGASARVIPESAIDELVEQFVVPAYAARVKPYEVLIFDVTLQTVH